MNVPEWKTLAAGVVVLSIAGGPIDAQITSCYKDCTQATFKCKNAATDEANRRVDQCESDFLTRHHEDCYGPEQIEKAYCNSGRMPNWQARANCLTMASLASLDCDDDLFAEQSRCLHKAHRQWNHDLEKCESNHLDCRRDCREECEQQHGAGSDQCDEVSEDPDSGIGSLSIRDAPCPPGTRPNTLGVCTAVFRSSHSQRPGEAGCPPGQAPGPADECVPVFSAGVFTTEDGYLLFCPFGTRPSPIDGGCVVDFQGGGDGTVGGDLGRPVCPPGTEPGLDDEPCVPVVRGGVTEAWRLQALAQVDVQQRLAEEDARAYAEIVLDVLFTTDLPSALEATAAALEATIEEP